MLRKSLQATLCASALLTSMPLLAVQTQQLPSEQGTLKVTQVTRGLVHPWALAFLPDQQGMLVTERPGDLRVVSAEGKRSAPLRGVAAYPRT
ncbi:Soluble aldose sugar dehydrogenase YliI precursor [compost metagenome]